MIFGSLKTACTHVVVCYTTSKAWVICWTNSRYNAILYTQLQLMYAYIYLYTFKIYLRDPPKNMVNDGAKSAVSNMCRSIKTVIKCCYLCIWLNIIFDISLFIKFNNGTAPSSNLFAISLLIWCTCAHYSIDFWQQYSLKVLAASQCVYILLLNQDTSFSTIP